MTEKEIHRHYDEHGVIRIIEDSNKRYLAFGEIDEQSCWLKTNPTQPQHDYTRAMLLVLLFCTPKRSLSLGLGSGALNACLHQAFPELKQDIIELRQGVVDAAYRYFQFPRSKRIKIKVQDAFEHLVLPPQKRVDLIFSDLYSANGLEEQQLGDNFLQTCQRHLKDHGWLVINCWREHRSQDLILLFKAYFKAVYSCATPGGNWIIFLGCQPCTIPLAQLRQGAKALSGILGFSLLPALKHLVSH